LSQKRHFFAEFFGKNIFLNHNIGSRLSTEESCAAQLKNEPLGGPKNGLADPFRDRVEFETNVRVDEDDVTDDESGGRGLHPCFSWLEYKKARFSMFFNLLF
jgi:hypothetical protein